MLGSPPPASAVRRSGRGRVRPRPPAPPPPRRGYSPHAPPPPPGGGSPGVAGRTTGRDSACLGAAAQPRPVR
eukprot:756145-Pyramimonas_sp.AAC.1